MAVERNKGNPAQPVDLDNDGLLSLLREIADNTAGGGGGGGDASAANQATEIANQATLITAVNLTNTRLAAGATSAAKVEDVASVDADVGVPAMAVRKAAPANTSGTDGDYEFLQMAAGRLWVDASGVTLTVASHAVTNATLEGAIRAEDVASADAHTGIGALAVRKATPANTSGTDGDYEFLQMFAGRLWASADITLGGVAVDGNSGNKSAGTLRVVLATDQPALTAKLLVTPDSVALPANQSVNAAQVNGVTPLMGSGVTGTGSLRVSLATDAAAISGYQSEPATDVTRPGDTTPYTAADCWSDSTSAPTSGGFTLSNAARVSGGGGVLTDIIVADSVVLPGTPLQGELWIFNQAVTNVNDNAAFTITDTEIKTCVAVVPFTIAKNGGANSLHHIQNLSIGYVCVGTANLRFIIKVINAYTPSASEVLSVRAKCIQNN